ncbi:cytochrome P450 [Trametopsis cervina]|nr:cytochrome P450 [Trametopsis cervina]
MDGTFSWSSVGPRTIVLVGVGAAAYFLKRYIVDKRRRRRHPPGPQPSWYGRVELPQEYQWRTYADWQEKYGDMIFTYVYGNPILILNTAEVVNDLFEKRSAIWSSRPHRTMVRDLVRFDWLFSDMSYGARWKKHRSLFVQYFTPSGNPNIRPVVEREVDVLLSNLLDHPEKMTISAIAMDLAYGHKIAPEGDAFVTLADQALQSLAIPGIFGTYLVDYIPLLRFVPSWMPGAEFQRQAKVWRRATTAMLEDPYAMVKRQMPSTKAAGTAPPSFTAAQLEMMPPNNSGIETEDEELLKNVAGMVYAGGADTTVNAVLSFFAGVLTHPEVQVKAQAEIDRVIGHNRLPTLDDRKDLPYIDGVLWESLRWNPAHSRYSPVIPLGIPRELMEDDEYRGYFIPKGTTVMPNQWAILHNEKVYPDPFKFDPDRYLNEERNRELGINELPMAAFGFGRRQCPGRFLAMDLVWLTAATVLATYNIKEPLDNDGRPVMPQIEYQPRMLSGPKPFQCTIVPRSDVALTLLKQVQDTIS